MFLIRSWDQACQYDLLWTLTNGECQIKHIEFFSWNHTVSLDAYKSWAGKIFIRHTAVAIGRDSNGTGVTVVLESRPTMRELMVSEGFNSRYMVRTSAYHPGLPICRFQFTRFLKLWKLRRAITAEGANHSMSSAAIISTRQRNLTDNAAFWSWQGTLEFSIALRTASWLQGKDFSC